MIFFVPLKSFRESHFPPWFNNELKKLIFEKKSAHLRYKRTNDFGDYMTFRELRNKCKSLTKRRYKDYISKVESNIGESPKNFWHFLNSIKKNHRIPGTMFLDDRTVTDSKGVADTFAEFSNSVYSHDDSLIENDLTTFDRVDCVDMKGVNITRKNIKRKISQLVVGKVSWSRRPFTIFCKVLLLIISRTFIYII